jgi:hypothetical protein
MLWMLVVRTDDSLAVIDFCHGAVDNANGQA